MIWGVRRSLNTSAEFLCCVTPGSESTLHQRLVRFPGGKIRTFGPSSTLREVLGSTIRILIDFRKCFSRELIYQTLQRHLQVAIQYIIIDVPPT